MAGFLLLVSACALLQYGQAACVNGLMSRFGCGTPLGGFSSPLGGFQSLGGCGMGYGYDFPYDGIAGPLSSFGVASTGGGLSCASASSIPPVGVSVLSENVYEGALAVGGELPFLGSVGVEGVLPTAGAGAVSYGCGSQVGVVLEEGAVATGIAPHAPFNAQFPFGYGPYSAGEGLGCGYGYNGYGYNGYGYPGYGYTGFGAVC